MFGRILEFIGLPSPSVLVGVVLAVATALMYGYHMGDVNGANRVEARNSKDKDSVVEALREQLKAASNRADAAETIARKIADQNAAFQTSFTPLLRSIRDAKPVPIECVPDDLRVRVNAAVSAINQYHPGSKTDFSIRMPSKLPGVTETTGK